MVQITSQTDLLKSIIVTFQKSQSDRNDTEAFLNQMSRFRKFTLHFYICGLLLPNLPRKVLSKELKFKENGPEKFPLYLVAREYLSKILSFKKMARGIFIFVWLLERLTRGMAKSNTRASGPLKRMS